MDQLIKSWKVKSPKSKIEFIVELWQKPNGKTYKIFRRLK
jgi:hypothetical protein